MMTETLTVETVMERAIGKEIEAQDMYRNLGARVDDAAARDMFRQLSLVEKKHEELLRQYRDGQLGEGSLHAGHVLDYRIAEHFNAPEITPDMKLEDVLLLAANREKASHDLYLSLAAAHPAGKIRGLFEELAEQELGHKHRLEDYYTDVAFPQTSGG